MLTVIIIFTLTCPAGAYPFSDIEDNWAYKRIAHLSNIGIVKGYNDNTFKPEQYITRTEFVKLIVAGLGMEEEAARLLNATTSYYDVADNFWGKPYIVWADEKGIVKGNGMQFWPDSYITREEAALIVTRALELEEDILEEDFEKEEILFTDKDDISEWAKEGVFLALKYKLINGYPDNSFRPQAFIKRDETVEIITKLLEKSGRLFDFSGILKNADNKGQVTIKIGSKERIFDIASNAVFAEQDKVIDSIADHNNIRVNFNVNSQGEITFLQFDYEDKYYDINVLQEEDSYVAKEPSLLTAKNQELKVLPVGSEWAEPVPESVKDPNLSLLKNKSVTNVNGLQDEIGTSGKDVVIAVIDSGIDPLHPDLQRNSNNSRKILDWVNLTEEGVVNISEVLTDQGDGTVNSKSGRIILPNMRSVSGNYRLGYWSEEWISFAHDIDFTGNKKTDDNIPVLLIDTKKNGEYDAVYVDTNGNNDMRDESPLYVYRDYKYNYASFPANNDLPQGFPFIACDISPDGRKVVFGYDSVGHGTHVAGIVSANGEIQGIAPDSRLISIKVVDSIGMTSLDRILEGIDYAIHNGADIINISLGQYFPVGEELERFKKEVNELAKNTLICVAAGNGGPGMGTLTSPGDIDNVLSVGAYISPDMWKTDYGWETEKEGLWYFNSTGPSIDGLLKPDIIAPGAAISTYPVWTGSKYYLKEGTSMAAPTASGISALLIEGMRESGRPVNSFMIKQAVISGARSLEQFSLVEQGHGLIDALNSWRVLKDMEALIKPGAVTMSSALFNNAPGIYARSLKPGIATLMVNNNLKESVFIDWYSNTDWFKIDNSTMQVAPMNNRTLDVVYNLPDSPGLYTGLIEGSIKGNSNYKVSFLNTVVVPVKFQDNKEYTHYYSLPAGQMKRYFFKIPKEASKLSLQLKILGPLSDLQGRARIHVFDPYGTEYTVTEYAGIAPPQLESKRQVEEVIESPESGVWEVVVYSSATLSLYDLEKTDYILSATIERTEKEKPKYVESSLLIGAAYPKGEKIPEVITLNVLDEKNAPFNGRILINDRLYEVKNGITKVLSNLERSAINLKIRFIVPSVR